MSIPPSIQNVFGKKWNAFEKVLNEHSVTLNDIADYSREDLVHVLQEAGMNDVFQRNKCIKAIHELHKDKSVSHGSESNPTSPMQVQDIHQPPPQEYLIASSMKWLSLSNTKGYSVNHEAENIFGSIGARQSVNLVCIMGPARHGKSLLMCELSGTSCFEVASTSQPYTTGVDLCPRLLSIEEFSTFDGGQAVHNKKYPSVAFLDLEGRGDQGMHYDIMLMAPLLVLSKVVIYNWRGGVEKVTILEQLGTVATVSESIGSKVDQPAFGHLYVVFRDWQFDRHVPLEKTATSVYSRLFDEEPAGFGDAAKQVIENNRIRTQLKNSFQSIEVVLLPSPVERTQDASDVIIRKNMTGEFRESVRTLRTKMVKALKEPKLYAGEPITACKLPKLMELLVKAVEQNDFDVPTQHKQLQIALSNQPMQKCLSEIKLICSQMEESQPLNTIALVERFHDAITTAESKLHTMLLEVAVPQDVQMSTKENFRTEAHKAAIQCGLKTHQRLLLAISQIQEEILKEGLSKLSELRTKAQTEPGVVQALLVDESFINTYTSQLTTKLAQYQPRREIPSTFIEEWKDLIQNVSLERSAVESALASLQQQLKTQKHLVTIESEAFALRLDKTHRENMEQYLKDISTELDKWMDSQREPYTTAQLETQFKKLVDPHRNKLDQTARKSSSPFTDRLLADFDQQSRKILSTATHNHSSDVQRICARTITERAEQFKIHAQTYADQHRGPSLRKELEKMLQSDSDDLCKYMKKWGLPDPEVEANINRLFLPLGSSSLELIIQKHNTSGTPIETPTTPKNTPPITPGGPSISNPTNGQKPGGKPVGSKSSCCVVS